ncbi:hypothetical protein [Desulfogranum marinum]|uniref:hypothetical protein n=1 Tax=Desulfogranum marinum TaxID=453220 RepID=UPI0029C62BCE|nr:hypothetical protein [Desulfogranum marinum]
MNDTQSFWTSLPGILSGIAAVIGAIVSLLLVLIQLNILPVNNKPPLTSDQKELSSLPTVPPPPSPDQVDKLESRIHEISVTINELEEKFATIPLPTGLIEELEHHREEIEKNIGELEQMLAAARQERDELRGQERTAPDISAHIHKLETETIPDLETHKRHMENELNSVAEEIPKAKERKEAEETLHQLQGEKQILQDQLDGLRMAEKLER